MSTDALHGHADIRLPSEQRPVSTIAPKVERRCTRCKAVLNKYHRGHLCMHCQDLEHEQRLDREIAEARELYGALSVRPLEHLLEELTCEELGQCAGFNHSTAHMVKRGARPLSPAEEAALRENVVHLVRMRRKPERPEKPPRREIVVEGIKLTPVDSLPGRQGGGAWLAKSNRVIQAFLDSGAEIVRIDNGKIHGHSIQTGLGTAIRRAGLRSQVYATYRDGACYLVRVEK